MSGAPTNRAIGETQHFSVGGIPCELVRELRVHSILDKRSMGDLVTEAIQKYLDERKRRNPK